MLFILSELLSSRINQLHQLVIPFAHDGFIRLKRIAYMARWHLRHRSSNEIEQACEDILNLYHWFYQVHENKFRLVVKNSIKEEEMLLSYCNVDKYVADRIKGLKHIYLDDMDILHAILNEFSHIQEFRQIEVVKSDFSNAEIFSVLALFKVSESLVALKSYQKEQLAKSKNSEIKLPTMLPSLLAKAFSQSQEAQVAIDYAQQLELKLQVSASSSTQDWMSLARQELSHQALSSKYGNQFQLRKQKAIELYKAGKFHSRREAAFKLIQPIQEFSEQTQLRLLKKGSEFDTIYKWLSQYDQHKKSLLMRK